MGGAAGEPKLLESAYRNSFLRALKAGARSIAFPCISTGVYGYPKRQAAQIATGVMRQFEPQFDRIVACCFGADDASIYRELLGKKD